jgi:pyruvate,water dikinase
MPPELLQQILDDPGYPGAEQAHRPERVRHERVAPFRPADLERFWLLEYRFPDGVTPLGMCYLDDCFAWATQEAAGRVPLPTSNGLTVRCAGTHVYFTEIEQPSADEARERAAALSRSLPEFLGRFPLLWEEAARELDAAARQLERHDPRGDAPAALAAYLERARAFQRSAWQVHWALMYPLLLNQAGFYGLCAELGIARAQVPRFLQGYETLMTRSDRALWAFARELRDSPLAATFRDHPPEAIAPALSRAGAAGAAWLARFDAFLDEWGWRTDGMADPRLPCWREDPTTPLGNLRTFVLDASGGHDFDAGLAAARAERAAAIDDARARLTRAERAAFDAGLASCESANFVWWNEDHNHYIDLRATIPLRRGALAAGAAARARTPDDVFFLFYPELVQVARGELPIAEFEPLIDARRDYHARWRDRRKDMPKYLGAAPETINDPILIEIDGVTDDFLAAVRLGAAPGECLRGLGAAPGRAQGRARVLHGPQELHRVEAGEVLVCEGTSPSWTPAFTKIAACVCDQGGTLAHASIISREYRVPCVVGTAVATRVISDGDLVDVDGSNGTVTVLKGA